MVLPHAIKEAAENGDLDQVKAWLAAAPADQPRDVNDPAVGGERLLALVAFGVSGINETGTLLAATAAHVELLRDLIARGADPSLNLRIDLQDPRNEMGIMEYFVDDPHGVAGWAESLSPLHIASDASKGPFAGDMVAAIAAAPGCDVNKKTTPATGENVRVAFPRTTPLGGALMEPQDPGTFAKVVALLRAGASLDNVSDNASAETVLQQWEAEVVTMHGRPLSDNFQFPIAANVATVNALVADVRRAGGSWKLWTLLPPKEMLRLRSQIARGKVGAARATPRKLAWLFSPDLPKEIAWRVFAYWNPRH